MGFWDTISKVDKVIGTVGVAAAGATAIGVGIGTIFNSHNKRKLAERDMTMKEQNAAAQRDFRVKELESKERIAMAEMQVDLSKTNIKESAGVQKSSIMYGGGTKPSVMFDHDNHAIIDNRLENEMNAMSTQANTQSVQQRILDAFEMKKNGIITDEEFAQMKAQILAGK